MPSTHSHEVTIDRAILLYGIVKEKYIYLGYVIYKSMLRFLQGSTTGAIPHGSIVTKLCRDVGIRWPAHEQLQMPSSSIDHSTIERMPEYDGGVPHGKGVGYVYDNVRGAS